MMFREKSLLRLLRVSGIIAGMAVSALSHAVGLGEINVFSAMSQPLITEIGLINVGLIILIGFLLVSLTVLLFLVFAKRCKFTMKNQAPLFNSNIAVFKPKLVKPLLNKSVLGNTIPIHPENGRYWVHENYVENVINEANIFLKFGRYKQAKEVLHDALLKEPNNQTIHLKILDIETNFQEGKIVMAR